MKILFTGGSSFTGYWFVHQLTSAGHDVTVCFRRRADDYPDPVRRERVKGLVRQCRPAFGVCFGDNQFFNLINETKWDVLCHHAADVTNYKSPDFDVGAAVRNNTHQLPSVLDALQKGGCNKIILTGSVFEPDEGAGSEPRIAFSPYGTSKGETWQEFLRQARLRKVSLGKFVIPNPFGPFEEPRFTQYLVKSWFAGTTPNVNTPDYVRDNIHVSLLAKVYVAFVEGLADGISRINPSGRIESQGSFALRFADEMQRRLGRRCAVELKAQSDFSEPLIRTNTDVIDGRSLNWSEASAWDELAHYYSRLLSPATL